MQCEDLYELISCLLPEVTASPAQHCIYSIFGKHLTQRGFETLFLQFSFCIFRFSFFSRHTKDLTCLMPYYIFSNHYTLLLTELPSVIVYTLCSLINSAQLLYSLPLQTYKHMSLLSYTRISIYSYYIPFYTFATTNI
jgi:hypothetical protein